MQPCRYRIKKALQDASGPVFCGTSLSLFWYHFRYLGSSCCCRCQQLQAIDLNVRELLRCPYSNLMFRKSRYKQQGPRPGLSQRNHEQLSRSLSTYITMGAALPSVTCGLDIISRGHTNYQRHYPTKPLPLQARFVQATDVQKRAAELGWRGSRSRGPPPR